ncbi:MAG: hypothetical protein U0992_10050 [Planctomycetaceae bacterium]
MRARSWQNSCGRRGPTVENKKHAAAPQHKLNHKHRSSLAPAHHSTLAMLLLLDNYDSFVHNLARYVEELGV